MCGFADSSWKEISGPFTCNFGSYCLYTKRMGFLPALHRLLPCCSNTTVRKKTCSLLWVLVHRLADCRLCPLLPWVILRTVCFPGLEFHGKTKLIGYKYYHLLLVSADRGKAWVTEDKYMWVMSPASLFLTEVLMIRQWQPTPVLLRGKSHGQRSLAGYGSWGCKESVTLAVFTYVVLGFISTLEKAMAPHSSTLAWKIPWTEEPGRLQSMGH